MTFRFRLRDSSINEGKSSAEGKKFTMKSSFNHSKLRRRAEVLRLTLLSLYQPLSSRLLSSKSITAQWD